MRNQISKNLSQNTNHTKLGHQPVSWRVCAKPGHWAVYLANHKACLSSTSSLGRHCICHCELSVISNVSSPTLFLQALRQLTLINPAADSADPRKAIWVYCFLRVAGGARASIFPRKASERSHKCQVSIAAPCGSPPMRCDCLDLSLPSAHSP